MRGAALIVAAAFLAGPAAAAPETQLERGVQQRLDRLGFSAVDAGSLTTRQLAALHLELQGKRLIPGIPALRTRERVRVILGWDGFETYVRR